MKKFTVFAALTFLLGGYAQAFNIRWEIVEDGRLQWVIPNGGIPHYDMIETSGKRISTVLRYGVNADGSFALERSFVFPMLRTVPNDTHGNLKQRSSLDVPSLVQLNVRNNGRSLAKEKVEKIVLDGTLKTWSTFEIRNVADWEPKGAVVSMRSTHFVSTDKPVFCEKYVLTNVSEIEINATIPKGDVVYLTDKKRGVDGVYTFASKILGRGSYALKPGESVEFGAIFYALKEGESLPEIDIDAELAAREAFVKEVSGKLVFKSPDRVIDNLFLFSKIRAAESIFETAGGPMHSPGGESFYAAIWANDQAEYVNPFFPFLGYDYANKSAMNCFAHFARFMNPEYKPIPSSIIAEGKGSLSVAGDRGDAAMVAYGAARYALACGSVGDAEGLWPLIEWCLEFCRRKLDKNGVVASDSDELENRFPAGDANLCTSALYYDALISAAFLSKNLGKGDELANSYLSQAQTLRENIDRHFSANVQGFDTYRYYDGNELLRAWICIPLTVGIDERKKGTVDALISDKLWTENGLLTIHGDKTFWDRSTLYALRGIFAAGEADRALPYLEEYSKKRLLSDRVPYPVEAYPERGMRHLSAESGLYCRIVTEGIFGIRPIGLKGFYIEPQLPKKWSEVSLSNVRAFGEVFDLRVRRMENGKLEVSVLREGRPEIKEVLMKFSGTFIAF